MAACSLWLIAFSAMNAAATENQAYLFVRIVYTGVTFIPALFYIFVLCFLRKELSRLLLIGFLSFQNLAYARDASHVGMRWGIIGRYRSLVPYRKVQAVVLRAGPIERMLKLATLTVYVAGGSPPVMSNLPRDEAEYLEHQLAVEAAASRFVW